MLWHIIRSLRIVWLVDRSRRESAWCCRRSRLSHSRQFETKTLFLHSLCRLIYLKQTINEKQVNKKLNNLFKRTCRGTNKMAVFGENYLTGRLSRHRRKVLDPLGVARNQVLDDRAKHSRVTHARHTRSQVFVQRFFHFSAHSHVQIVLVERDKI